MEVEIVTFVVKGSAQLTVPPDRQESIQAGSRGAALRGVFDLKLSSDKHSPLAMFTPILFYETKTRSSNNQYIQVT